MLPWQVPSFQRTVLLLPSFPDNSDHTSKEPAITMGDDSAAVAEVKNEKSLAQLAGGADTGSLKVGHVGREQR